jgi:hypothetical protein
VNVRTLSIICFASLGLLVFNAAARADEWDKRTIVTFNEPVEIPGMVLPAGTYVMKLADLPSDRNVVQFYNKDETKLLDTVLAIPEYRMQPADHSIFTFEERKADAPRALKSWFYPGDNYGEEFIYRKPVKLSASAAPAASQSSTPAVAAAKPVAAPPPSSPVNAQAGGSQRNAANAPTVVAQNNPPAASRQPAAQAPAPAAAPAQPKELPKTASTIPLTALTGAVSLGLASLVRLLRA